VDLGHCHFLELVMKKVAWKSGDTILMDEER
jgi:hypothetical protein